MSTLAVVVLNWNGLADTRALLPTLAACRVPAGWRVQVVVVDNGSSDGSPQALAAEFPRSSCWHCQTTGASPGATTTESATRLRRAPTR